MQPEAPFLPMPQGWDLMKEGGCPALSTLHVAGSCSGPSSPSQSLPLPIPATFLKHARHSAPQGLAPAVLYGNGRPPTFLPHPLKSLLTYSLLSRDFPSLYLQLSLAGELSHLVPLACSIGFPTELLLSNMQETSPFENNHWSWARWCML